MNIWVIQTGETLPILPGTRWMRSGLSARELARRGHDVTWWASAFDHYSRNWVAGSQETELAPGIKLRTLRGLGYSANLSLRRFVDHALVARAFAKAAEKQQSPDVIVAAMPDYRIAHAAWRYARDRGIPFVLDLRDRWPWDFLEHFPKPVRPLARLGLTSDFSMARELLSKADSVVTMMETWGDWIAHEGGRTAMASDRVFYLGAERLKPDPKRVGRSVQSVLAAANGRWPILFVGAFTNRSWPRQAVEAFQQLQPRPHDGQRPLLILAGDGDRRAELQAMAGDSPDIHMPGFVNDAEIAALLAISKIGLTTLNGDYEAVPNKVFTYLSGGLPIISSIGGELEGMLAREGVGVTCRTPQAMARELIALMEDEPLRADMAHRAQALFDNHYEAGKLYGAYADHIENMALSATRSG